MDAKQGGESFLSKCLQQMKMTPANAGLKCGHMLSALLLPQWDSNFHPPSCTRLQSRCHKTELDFSLTP